jgi:hypothetical protein
MADKKYNPDVSIPNEEKALRRQALSQIPVMLQVRDSAHARSEEVIRFTIGKLREGHTWTEVRKMLGLGNAAIDRRWRLIKEIICSSVMPENEEEALKASYSLVNYTLDNVEKFLDRVQERSLESLGTKNEPDMLKLELEAMKLQLEVAQNKFEHYMKMKEISKKDQRGTGASIVVQNNYYIPRPGDKLEEARNIARTVIEAARSVDETK